MDELLCNLCVRASSAAAFSMQTAFLFRFALSALRWLWKYIHYTFRRVSQCAGRAAQPSLKWCRIKRFILQMWAGGSWGTGALSSESFGGKYRVSRRRFIKGVQPFYVTLPMTFSSKSPTLWDTLSFSIFSTTIEISMLSDSKLWKKPPSAPSWFAIENVCWREYVIPTGSDVTRGTDQATCERCRMSLLAL